MSAVEIHFKSYTLLSIRTVFHTVRKGAVDTAVIPHVATVEDGVIVSPDQHPVAGTSTCHVQLRLFVPCVVQSSNTV